MCRANFKYSCDSISPLLSNSTSTSTRAATRCTACCARRSAGVPDHDLLQGHATPDGGHCAGGGRQRGRRATHVPPADCCLQGEAGKRLIIMTDHALYLPRQAGVRQAVRESSPYSSSDGTRPCRLNAPRSARSDGNSGCKIF